jgi:hypothetical protein
MGDGKLWVPPRGKPPKSPAGYKATANPYVFEPVLEACSKRTEEIIQRSCCDDHIKLTCVDRLITPKDCIACLERDGVVSIPEEVWLIGKGPSIDFYDWSKAGWKCGINEAALIFKCDAAIAYDYHVLDKYKTSLPAETMVLRKSTHRNYSFANEYIWTKRKEVFDLTATAPIAIQILHYLGAKTIHFIGFDSMTIPNAGYANSISAEKHAGTNNDDFKRINNIITKLIEKLGIIAIWEHDQ